MTEASDRFSQGRHHEEQLNVLRARRLGIDTRQENLVFMRKDCHICRSEGFSAHARIRLIRGEKSVIATLYQVTSDLLESGEIGLSDSAWAHLSVEDGTEITVAHTRPLASLSTVRGKVYGRRLDGSGVRTIVEDILAGRYSDIHLSSFITACSARSLDRNEVTALTRAMIETGQRLDWDVSPVVDKHCVGGLPGNRTTPIVVAIVAACGLTIPKTSSRAITSPSGTADTMETLAPVDLDLLAMRRVVEREGGCIVWGGAVRLSPVDDILIRVERALDLDSEGQLVASVLSKKIAAGSTHLVLDLPVGPTAKVRSPEAAAMLSTSLRDVAGEFGLTAHVVTTDGTQPVGRGIGPALEAREVLSVLQGAPDHPSDLRARAVALAGVVLELAGAAPTGTGESHGSAVLEDGRAWTKFQRICEAQGGLRQPPTSLYRYPIPADHAGRVLRIDNRQIARAAKLAGAPDAKAAGVELHVRVGDRVEKGAPLFTLHAETPGELEYALAFANSNGGIICLEET